MAAAGFTGGFYHAFEECLPVPCQLSTFFLNAEGTFPAHCIKPWCQNWRPIILWDSSLFWLIQCFFVIVSCYAPLIGASQNWCYVHLIAFDQVVHNFNVSTMFILITKVLAVRLLHHKVTLMYLVVSKCFVLSKFIL